MTHFYYLFILSIIIVEQGPNPQLLVHVSLMLLFWTINCAWQVFFSAFILILCEFQFNPLRPKSVYRHCLLKPRMRITWYFFSVLPCSEFLGMLQVSVWMFNECALTFRSDATFSWVWASNKNVQKENQKFFLTLRFHNRYYFSSDFFADFFHKYLVYSLSTLPTRN